MSMENPMRRDESESGKISNHDSLKDLVGKEAANDASEPKPDIQGLFEEMANGEAFEEGPRINPITKKEYTPEELAKLKENIHRPLKKKDYTEEELDDKNPLTGGTLREWFKKMKHRKGK